MRAGQALAALALAGQLAAGCGGAAAADVPAPAPAPTVDLAAARAVLAIPAAMQVPAFPPENPPTAEKVALGRHLFYERRLSANQTQACADCHLQALAMTDGKVRPTGSTGQQLRHNSPALINAAYNATFTWANRGLTVLEDQLQIPVRADSPVELGDVDGVAPAVEARFAADPLYASLFAAAFPTATAGPTLQQAVLALATFCRTLVANGSPYDRHLAGDAGALTPSQARGLALFEGERLECFHCHSGVNLSVSYRDAHSVPGTQQLPFFNNGLYNVGNRGDYPPLDQGLYDTTLQPNDRGKFRPQSLRNVALTAPYMHDGSLATLRDVIGHYAAGGTVIADGPLAGDGRLSPLKSNLVSGFAISEDEIVDLLAFFDALTDPSALTDPRFADPSAP